MSKYERLMRRYYKNKKKSKIVNEKLKKTYFDSLFIRFFLSSILLLIMVLLNTLFGTDIKSIINKNMNITKVGENIFSIFIEKPTDSFVSSTSQYEEILFDENSNIIKSISYNGVNNFQSGTVIKIEMKNNKYIVTIQTSNDYLYVYKNLESIDCQLYEYLETNESIGTSSYQNNQFLFVVDIIKDNKYYSLNNL